MYLKKAKRMCEIRAHSRDVRRNHHLCVFIPTFFPLSEGVERGGRMSWPETQHACFAACGGDL